LKKIGGAPTSLARKIAAAKKEAAKKRGRGKRASKLPAKFAMFRLVVITERSANLL